MEIVLLPSAINGAKGQALTSFVIDGRLAVDAGALGIHGSVESQARIENILLTHSHLDHIAGLPIFVDNIYDDRPECVNVYGLEETLECLKRDFFNERVYPDMVAMSQSMPPFLRLTPIPLRQRIAIGGYQITAVPINHAVPTAGYIIEDESTAVAIVTDTGPTDEIWEVMARMPQLKAVFLDVSYPEAEQQIAEVAKHLTTEQFAAEVRKIPRRAAIYAIHIKPRYYDVVVAELKALRLPRVKIAKPGRIYRF